MPGIVPDIVDTMYAAAIENQTAAENAKLKQVIADLLTYQPNAGTQLYADACKVIGRAPPPPLPPYVGGEHDSPPIPARPYSGHSRYGG